MVDDIDKYETQLQSVRDARPYAKQYVLYLLTNVDDWNRIADLQESRLLSGWERFKDRMFRWDSRRQEQEIRKLLSDALNYACALYSDHARSLRES